MEEAKALDIRMDTALIVGIPGAPVKKKGAGVGSDFLNNHTQVCSPYFAGLKTKSQGQGKTYSLIYHTKTKVLLNYNLLLILCAISHLMLRMFMLMIMMFLLLVTMENTIPLKMLEPISINSLRMLLI